MEPGKIDWEKIKISNTFNLTTPLIFEFFNINYDKSRVVEMPDIKYFIEKNIKNNWEKEGF